MATKTICFTDMEEYTSKTESFGADKMRLILEEHKRVGVSLVEANNGKYEKDIGDAHMGIFDEPDDALRFAAQFQQYYLERPCFNREDLKFSIGLATGLVKKGKGVTFGSGVNLAARVESHASSLTVLVDSNLVKDIEKIWNEEEAKKYFKSIGNVNLKGFDDEERELFVFNFNAYLDDSEDGGLAGHVYTCLESSDTVPTNLTEKDLNSPGHIIWPVVPRDLATAIHRGQIEVIRLLALLGWEVNLILADCGSLINTPRSELDSFCDDIKRHAAFRNLNIPKIYFLSDFYNPEKDEHKDVVNIFREITRNLNVNTLLSFNEKNYSEDDKEKIQTEPMLDFLRPALTSAVVVFLTNKLSTSNIKTIVISGEDEAEQYNHLIDSMQKILGAIYIPRLEKKPEKDGVPYTARQQKNWPIWYSKPLIKDDIQKTNAAKWIFHLFAKLPSFPSKEVIIAGDKFEVKEWNDNKFYIPDNIDIIIDEVWDLLNPAR